MQFSRNYQPEPASISRGLKAYHARNKFVEALLGLYPDRQQDKTLYDNILDDILETYKCMNRKDRVDWILDIIDRFAPKSKEEPSKEQKYQLVLTKEDEGL